MRARKSKTNAHIDRQKSDKIQRKNQQKLGKNRSFSVKIWRKFGRFSVIFQPLFRSLFRSFCYHHNKKKESIFALLFPIQSRRQKPTRPLFIVYRVDTPIVIIITIIHSYIGIICLTKIISSSSLSPPTSTLLYINSDVLSINTKGVC